MARPVLLDTCAAIWLMNGDRLSPASLAAIREAQAANAVYVSPITAWEIATVVARKRVVLTLSPNAWFNLLIAQPGVNLAPMLPALLIASAHLPGTPPRDPADRIIAATSREYGFVVITRDGELLPYAQARHIDAIAC
jgi:PIN domain nuclease of toxin-antitoxin system